MTFRPAGPGIHVFSCFKLLSNNNLNGNIFIKKADINYNKPIDCNFIFKSTLPDDKLVKEFIDRLISHNKATIEINSKSSNAGGKINHNVLLTGHYTVISKNDNE